MIDVRCALYTMLIRISDAMSCIDLGRATKAGVELIEEQLKEDLKKLHEASQKLQD